MHKLHFFTLCVILLSNLPALATGIDLSVVCKESNYAGVKFTGLDFISIIDELEERSENIYRLPNFCGIDLSHQDLGHSDLSNLNLSYANLEGASFAKTNISNSNFSSANLSHANIYITDFDKSQIYGADFSNSTLEHVSFENNNMQETNLTNASGKFISFKGANLVAANLTESDFRNTEFTGADMTSALLINADLSGSNLTKTILVNTNFTGSNLLDVNFHDVEIRNANFSATIFEPKPGTHPPLYLLGTSQVDDKLRYEKSPIGLITLRHAFRESGLRQKERQLTYSIEKERSIQLLSGTLINKIEGLTRTIFFEWTVGYGLYPARALLIILLLIPTFGSYYFVCLTVKQPRFYRIWPPQSPSEKEGAEFVLETTTMKRLIFSTQFSLLSAFHLGWRDLNVGSWLARLQLHNYSISAIGWPRVVSGVQSLVSIYLLAMWVLTQFGRPF